MPARFSMETDEGAEAVRVSLHGEFDMARAEEVEAQLARIESAAPARLVLDLRGLTFLDSSGLRVIITAGARSRRAGLPLTVVRGPEQVNHVFEITGMDRELPMVDDPAEPPPGDADPPQGPASPQGPGSPEDAGSPADAGSPEDLGRDDLGPREAAGDEA